MTLKLGDNILAQSADVSVCIDAQRHARANVNASETDFIAKQLACPLKQGKKSAFVLHSAIELAQESFFLRNPIVGDRERNNYSRPPGFLNCAKNSTLRCKETSAAAARSFRIELERMSCFDKLGDLLRKLRIGGANSAPNVERTRGLKQTADNRDLREIIARCNTRKLETKSRMREAEKRSDEEIQIAAMTRSKNHEIVRADLSDSRANLELVERDFRRRFSQRLANDISEDARSSISFRLLECPPEICPVHSERCLHRVSLEKMLGDSVRH